MKTLPFELLTLIFSYLPKSDLLQCQLTCKNWYEASVEQLYSKTVIDTYEKSFLFVRTLSNSTRLGNYVQNISTFALFNTKTDGTFWDQHRLLNTLIRQCPNLSGLNADDPDLSFYARVSHAAHQGQLSRLCVLPLPDSASLECYIYTALLFKSSLTTLSLQDSGHYFGLDLDLLEAYQTLKEQISEFKNLQVLEFFYASNKRLSQFDIFIEDCPHLKEITIDLQSMNEQEEMISFEGVISPRPDIRKLETSWEMINDRSQLCYLIQKFPNLQTLNIITENSGIDEAKHISCDDLIKYLCYAAVIPNFTTTIKISNQQLTKSWIEMMKLDEKFREVTLNFDYYSNAMWEVYLQFESGKPELIFMLGERDTEMPHTDFFSKVGSMIRSLDIRSVHPDIIGMELWNNLYEPLSGIDWIFQTIKLCPSLQELKITGEYKYKIEPEFIPSQHQQVRKLSIDWIGVKSDFLHLIEQQHALVFPNLKYLQLRYERIRSNKSYYRVVSMPGARLDILVWENLPFDYDDQESFNFYVKLELDIGVKFYQYNSQIGVLAIDEQQYNQSNTKFRFEVTCFSLAKLIIYNNTATTIEKLLELII